MWIIHYKTWWQDVCPWQTPRMLFFRNILICNYNFIFQSIQMSWWHIQSTDNNTGKNNNKKSSTKINKSIASLISQWLRICLALQGTRVWSSVWEDPISLGATKAIHHNYWACAVEPSCLNYLTTEPMHWNYWSPHLEPELRNKRSHHNKRPVHHRKVASTCHN